MQQAAISFVYEGNPNFLLVSWCVRHFVTNRNPRSRCGVVAIVGSRNADHTQFVSHIGASAPDNFRAGVIKDMSEHFIVFWEKFYRHLKKLTWNNDEYSQPPGHLIIYRSSPSGSSQQKEIVNHEIAAIRRVLEAELGNVAFNAETQEVVLEHPVVSSFPDAAFTLTLDTCSAADAAQFNCKAEELLQNVIPRKVLLRCEGATVNSEGQHSLRFSLEEATRPLLTRPCWLSCVYTLAEAEPFTVSTADSIFF